MNERHYEVLATCFSNFCFVSWSNISKVSKLNRSNKNFLFSLLIQRGEILYSLNFKHYGKYTVVGAKSNLGKETDTHNCTEDTKRKSSSPIHTEEQRTYDLHKHDILLLSVSVTLTLTASVD